MDAKSGTRKQVVDRARVFLLRGEDLQTSPYWPKGSSGITWGIGWDAGQHSADEIRQIWHRVQTGDLDRLVNAERRVGDKAREYLPEVVDIEIPEAICLEVFEESLSRYYDLIAKTFPGAHLLPAEVQVALISLIYNRGTRMHDKNTKKHDDNKIDSRYEMRLVRRAVHGRDIVGIYEAIRKMERVWKGTKIEKGMRNRREAEAALLQPYLEAVRV